MKRTLNTDPASAPVSGRVTPVDDSGDAGAPPRASRGRTATRTGPPDAEAPMPGQTELLLEGTQ